MKHICPVCGFDGLKEAAYLGELGSNEMCKSCGYEFGYHDDDQEITHEQWRAQWMNKGMPWSIDDMYKPPHWNPKAQLRRIGVIVP